MKKFFSDSFLVSALSLTVGCSPAAPSKVLNANPDSQKVTDLTESFNPQVDILFVVDNSGSMYTHQYNFTKNLEQFVRAFTKQSLSYHIGAISSDTGNRGELQGRVRFVDNSTLNGIDIFAENILGLGTAGSGLEAFFDPLVAAFQPYNLSGPNRDFLRQDSVLVTVLITDAEDQSLSYQAQSTFDFLTKLKGGSKYLLGYGVIIPSNYSASCARDDSLLPVKLENFLGLFQNAPNNVMGLCDPNYGDQLAQFSRDIASIVGSTIFLKRLPKVDTIQVLFGDQKILPEIDTGWVYDAERNAVVLGSKIDFSKQPAGTKVQISYDSISL